MDWMKLAVGLELGGFIFASISVYLKIGFLKKIADRLKGAIVLLDERIRTFREERLESSSLIDALVVSMIKEFALKQFIILPQLIINRLQILWLFKRSLNKLKSLKRKYPDEDFIFDKDVAEHIEKQIVENEGFQRATEDIKTEFLELIGKLKIGEEESVRSAYEQVKITSKRDTKTGIKLSIQIWILTIANLLTNILKFTFEKIEKPISKLTEANFITDSCIVLGTFSVFVGLVIEFIFS